MPLFPNGWNFDPPVGPGGPPDAHNEYFVRLTEGGQTLRVESFDNIPVGQLELVAGILDGTGNGVGPWQVVQGTLISGPRHSQINITTGLGAARGIAYDSTNFVTVFASMSLSVVPTTTTPILSVGQGTAVATAQVAITTTGLFQMRDEVALSGTTYEFRPGKLYQLIWQVNVAASTQQLAIYDQYGALLSTLTAGVTTAAKTGIARLRFGAISAPGPTFYGMQWDHVGVLVGQGQTISPTISVDPGSPAWLLTPPGQVVPNSIPVEDPYGWWTWDAGVPVSASNAATGTGSLELSGSGVAKHS